MNIHECIQKGLLIKENPDALKSKKSLDIAKHKLENAKKQLTHNIIDEALVTTYTSMFHASRALLFKEGIREKSHYAVYIYIKEKYNGIIERRFLSELNHLRLERHNIFYGLENREIEQKEVKKSIELVDEYIKKIEELLTK